MAWVWTKQFSSLDDGSILYGVNLETLQSDIVNNAVDLSSTQTITGTKTFSGTVNFSGTLEGAAKVADYVFSDGELMSWEDEAVIYQ